MCFLTFQQPSHLQLWVVDEILTVSTIHVPISRLHRCVLSAQSHRACILSQPTEAVVLCVEVLVSLFLGHDVGTL